MNFTDAGGQECSIQLASGKRGVVRIGVDYPEILDIHTMQPLPMVKHEHHIRSRMYLNEKQLRNLIFSLTKIYLSCLLKSCKKFRKPFRIN